MLIISKYKDYYDYLAGVYGEDSKLILDRREGNAKPIIREGVITLFICDKVIQGYFKNNRFYWGKSQLDIISKDVSKQPYWMKKNGATHKILRTTEGSTRVYEDYLNCNLIEDLRKTNTKNNCPILLSIMNGGDITNYPSLIALNFAPIITAHNIWDMLSSWLGYQITLNEPDVPIGDDKVRIQSHGFDLKQSFRHRK